MSGRDTPAFVSGIVVLALGTLLLLDRAGAFDLHLSLITPAFLAAIGAILLAAGLDRRDRADDAAP